MDRKDRESSSSSTTTDKAAASSGAPTVATDTPGRETYLASAQRQAAGPLPAAASVGQLMASPAPLRSPSPSDRAFGPVIQRKTDDKAKGGDAKKKDEKVSVDPVTHAVTMIGLHFTGEDVFQHDPAKDAAEIVVMLEKLTPEQRREVMLRLGPSDVRRLAGMLPKDKAHLAAGTPDHAELGGVDERALFVAERVKLKVEGGDLDAACELLGGESARNLMFVLGRLRDLKLLAKLQTHLAGIDKPASRPYPVAQIKSAVDTVAGGAATASPGAANATVEAEVEAFTQVRDWPKLLDKAHYEKAGKKETAAGPAEPAKKLQLIVDYIKLQRASLLDYLRSRHPDVDKTPRQPNLNFDGARLGDALKVLFAGDEGVRDRLLDSGIAFEGGRWLAVNTSLVAVEEEKKALALIGANPQLADLITEIAHTRAGWSKATPDKGDPTKPGWNAQEWSVDEKGKKQQPGTTADGARFFRRLPLDGLANVQQSEASTDGFYDDAKEKKTSESAAARAIVVVPSTFKADQPVDVLLHLHGNSAGNRQRRTGNVDDVTDDQVGQQLLATGRNIIGILPQGTMSAGFGPGAQGLQSDALIAEVLDRLRSLDPPVLAGEVKRGNTILSAHSGGGIAVGQMLTNNGKNPNTAKAPSGTNEVVVFEAVNKNKKSGFDDTPTYSTWLTQQLNKDHAAMTDLGNEERLAYLKTSMRFRGYYGGSGYYTTQYDTLKRHIDTWFAKHASDYDAPVLAAFKDNFQVIFDKTLSHGTAVGEGRLAKSLEPPPAAATP